MKVTRWFLAAMVFCLVWSLSDVNAQQGKGGGKGMDQEKLLQQLAARVQKLEDMIEIQKLQSQYGYLLFTQRYDKIPALFAKRAEGIQVEFSDSGVYLGYEGVQRLYKAFEATKDVAGFFTLHMTVNPYIVIAKDGQSAKSAWLSPGAASNGQAARWIWGPYYVDYAKEDGVWKIRRTCFAPLFRNEYEKSWLTSIDHGTVTKGLPSKPDLPPTLYRPFDKNRKDMFKDSPPLPEPY
jgi:SnoaL-like protein